MIDSGKTKDVSFPHNLLTNILLVNFLCIHKLILYHCFILVLVKSPRSTLRQRTTSVSQSTKKTASESVLQSHTRTIYTAGRPPWYNTAGQQVEPFVIGELSIIIKLHFCCITIFYAFIIILVQYY